MVLPPLPVLVSFKAYIEPGCPPLRLELDRLPRLEEVELRGSANEGEADHGSAELVAAFPAVAAGPAAASSAPAAPIRLRRLRLDLSSATLDFAAMPALARADIWAAEVAGGASLAAASSLTHLQLGSSSASSDSMYPDKYELDKLWVLDALGALPPTLRTLHLRGTSFHAELGAALARAASLHTLCLSIEIPEFFHDEEDEEGEAEEDSVAIGPGPLWRSLRALRLPGWERLPQALASAEDLEVLDLSLNMGGRRDSAFLEAAAGMASRDGEAAGS
ncbi:hypothetical protein ABPG75_000777 [Micractinium tetrahymenae]